MLDALEHPLHYLANCVISSTSIVGQVGSGVLDHKLWSSTKAWDNRNRKAYKITSGSDLGGEMAAALAAGSIVYQEVDPEFSQMLLEKAKLAYKFADSKRGKYSDRIHDVAAFYKSWSGYNDELVWGAAWLYRAIQETTYLSKAKQYYDQYSMSGRAYMFDWDDKRGGCQVLMAQLTGDSKYWQPVTQYGIFESKLITPKF